MPLGLRPDFAFTPQPGLAPLQNSNPGSPLVGGANVPGGTPPWGGSPLPIPSQPPPMPSAPPVPAAQSAGNLGPLELLVGRWTGKGLNIIWRPSNQPGADHFLELNVTGEQLEFDPIPGDIPNRGLRQSDISMRGLRYLQQIQDANTGGGLHIEPGVWAFVPGTSNPLEPETVVRMASIPHGTTVLAQGTFGALSGPPTIPPASITPMMQALPNMTMTFAESNLAQPSGSRSPPLQISGITQPMLDDPNSLLRADLLGKSVRQTTFLMVSSAATPVIGGGTANTAFLIGGSDGPNAQASLVTATFWIEELEVLPGMPPAVQLQYSQTVMLDFNGVRWPHVSVATLQKVATV